MDARRRTFNVDVDFLDSKEVLSIPEGSRAAAIMLWLKVGCWSRRKNTDGRVSAAELRALKANPRLVRLLIRSTLWQADPVTTPPDDVDALQRDPVAHTCALRPDIIDPRWAKWQMTSGDIERIRKADRARQKRSRDAAKDADTGADADLSRRDADVTDVASNGHVTRDIDEPANRVTALHGDVSRRDLKQELERGSSVGSSGAVGGVPVAATFPDHCDEHRHDPDPPKCPKCRRTREQNAAAAERAAAVEAVKLVDARLRENARRAACIDCDEHGWLYGDDQLVLDPACRCTHPDIP